ncbi:MAG TPA: redoxin domain-containing protein [Gemmataceae bacterium]|nr:redoxin domain-containing protein [Gemmataceae bacterium]
MMNSLCLLTCVLCLGQAAGRADWQPTPQLTPGLELVYTGSYTEESLIPNAAHQTQYRLETNVLVLDAGVKDWRVAILSSLSLQQYPQPKQKKNADGPTSMRLALANVDWQGRLRQDKKLMDIPLKEPPTLELGYFIPAPLGKIGKSSTWDISDPGKPAQRWQVVGTESCGGLQCIKVMAVQQSPDWDHVRADTIAWRRLDTIWIHPQLFVAQKVERIIEQRAAAREAPTSRSVVKYELDSQLRYPGQMFEQRKSDAVNTAKLQDDAQLLMRQPMLNRKAVDAAIHRVAYHLEHPDTQQATPYRKLIGHLKVALEKAKAGEMPVRSSVDDPQPLTGTTVEVGKRAPDFTASSLISATTHRLGDHRGKPVVVFFYNPSTALGREVMAYMKRLSDTQADRLAIFALAVTQDGDLVRAQHKELKLSFPILDGNGMRLSYGATDTPRFVVLDGDAVVRFAETGWGYHTPYMIEEVLQQSQKK